MRGNTLVSQSCRCMSWLMLALAAAVSACTATFPEASADQTTSSNKHAMAGEIQPVSMQAEDLNASQFLEILQSGLDRSAGKLDFAAIKRHFGVEFNASSASDKARDSKDWVEIKPSTALKVAGIEAMTLKQSEISLSMDAAVPASRTVNARNVIQQDLEIRLKANQLCVQSADVHDAFKTQIQSGQYKYGGTSRMAAPSWSNSTPEAVQTLQRSRGNGPWVNVITVEGPENRTSGMSIHFEHEFYACAQRVLLRARQ
jgi:hypothetical protein